MTTSDAPSTHLRPPWLNITRALWVVLAGLSIVTLIASIAIAVREPLPSCASPDAICGPWSVTREDQDLARALGLPGGLLIAAYLGGMIVTKLAFVVVGLLVFLRRSDDWMGQLVSLMLVMFAVEGVQNLEPVMPLVSALYVIPAVIFVLLPFIFPDGRFVPRWTKWALIPLLLLTVTASSLSSPQRLAFMLLVYTPLYMLSYLGIPLGVAFAILRYRLWDIDVLVRKTLIYTVLTGLLALVFFGVVSLASGLFSALTGRESALAVVVSTLVIAALFIPLRKRVQEGIDRRFYRKKYDAQKVLAQFALFARDETDLDALTGELARVFQETLQPESVSIWLRK